MEEVLDDGNVSTRTHDVLSKWKADFSSLFNADNVNFENLHIATYNNQCNFPVDSLFNEHISLFEVKKSIYSAKLTKACGFDNIPSDVLRNETAVSFLHIFFNICFDVCVIPSDWGKCIINPIPKSCTEDRRNPLSYRGIALASSMYKLYCSILNDRLCRWSEDYGKIVDEQKGFREKRSTVDHLSPLTTLLDTMRILKRHMIA